MSGEYEIEVHCSEALGDWCKSEYSVRDEAIVTAKKYIEDAFDRKDDLGLSSVNVIIGDDTISAPTQYYDVGFYEWDPCNSDDYKYYDSLLGWWDDYFDCKQEAADSNILITKTDESDGGRAGVSGNMAVVQVGEYVAKTSRFASYDWGEELTHSAIHTVLHELGHNLSSGSIYDYDVDDPAHKLGDDIYRSDASNNWTHTPLATDGEDNVCDQYITSVSDLNYELTWGDCCIDHWRDPK